MKKGQMDVPIISFAVILIALIIIAPIMLKVVNVPLEKFGEVLGNQSNSSVNAVRAGSNVDHVRTVFINFWDKVVMMMFLLAVLLLFVAAFLIDVHPAFLVIHIIVSTLLVIFGSDVLEAAREIYAHSEFTQEVALIPFTEFFLNNFGIILLGIIVLSGVVMYAKLKFMGERGY